MIPPAFELHFPKPWQVLHNSFDEAHSCPLSKFSKCIFFYSSWYFLVAFSELFWWSRVLDTPWFGAGCVGWKGCKSKNPISCLTWSIHRALRAAESSRIEFPQAPDCPASMHSLHGGKERSNNIDSTASPGKMSGYIKIWHDLSGIDDPSWIKPLCLCLLGKHGRFPVSCQQLLGIESRLNPFINWFSLPGRSTGLTLRAFLSKTELLRRA